MPCGDCWPRSIRPRPPARGRWTRCWDRLDGLRRQHPELARGRFDLTRLTRSVLHLDPGEQLTDATVTELLRVALQRPRAASLAELSAYHLATHGEGLFADRYRLPTGAQSRPAGWNWSADGIPGDADLGVAAQVVEREDGTRAEKLIDTPWGAAYLYSASSGPSWISLPGFGGRLRRVPFEVFTELPAFDPDTARVPQGTDLLLAMPQVSSRGIHLADGLVSRYGMNVLSSSGRLEWTRTAEDPDRSVLAITARERQEPLGGWLRRDPETVRAVAARGLGDAAHWSRRVSYWPLVGDDNRLIGYASMDFAEENDGGWDTTSFYSRFTAGTPVEKYVIRYADADRLEARTVPWVAQALPSPVFGVAHGLAGTTAWHTPRGTRTTSGPETGRLVAGLVALTGLPDSHPFVMDHCYGMMPRQPGTLGEEGASVHDTDPGGADPLFDRSEADHVADALGRTVLSHRHVSTVGVSPTCRCPASVPTRACSRCNWTRASRSCPRSTCSPSRSPVPGAKRWTRSPGAWACTRAPGRRPPRSGARPWGWCGCCARPSSPSRTATGTTVPLTRTHCPCGIPTTRGDD
ncbi:lonely Cys domain-containing protein [Streptomyces sp. GKU 257-1]|nr:lonely Cys domain-containing protein [Streptomyces sp. GKU 257-1]